MKIWNFQPKDTKMTQKWHFKDLSHLHQLISILNSKFWIWKYSISSLKTKMTRKWHKNDTKMTQKWKFASINFTCNFKMLEMIWKYPIYAKTRKGHENDTKKTSPIFTNEFQLWMPTFWIIQTWREDRKKDTTMTQKWHKNDTSMAP